MYIVCVTRYVGHPGCVNEVDRQAVLIVDELFRRRLKAFGLLRIPPGEVHERFDDVD